MAANRCCVPGCDKNQKGASNVIRHKFPNPVKERERFTTWVLKVGGDIIGLDNQYIFLNRRVCHQHFEDKYVCRSMKLCNIAVPTLNMPDPKAVPSFTMSVNERKHLKNIGNIIETLPEETASTSNKYSSVLDPSTSDENTLIIPSSSIENSNIKDVETASTSKKYSSVLDPSTSDENTSIIPSSSIENSNIKDVGLPETKLRHLLPRVNVLKRNSTKREKELYRKLLSLKVKIAKIKKSKKKLFCDLKTYKNLSTNPDLLKAIEKLPERFPSLLIRWTVCILADISNNN